MGEPVPVTSELSDGVGHVMFRRPERLNATGPGTFPALARELATLGENPECRAIVISGEGTSFCAGMDMKQGLAAETVADPVEASYAGLRTGAEAIATLRAIPQPVIAGVRGHAVGAGFAIAAACDLRFASPDVSFNAPFLKLGMTAGDLGLSWFLPRIVGAGHAAEIFYSTVPVDADTAVRIGLVSKIVDDPVAEALAFARALAERPPYGVTVTKELLNATWSTPLHAHLDAEKRAQVIGLATENHRRIRTDWANGVRP